MRPFFVVATVGVTTRNAVTTVDHRDLLANADQGRLGKVHVTPSGDVWGAADGRLVRIEGL